MNIKIGFGVCNVKMAVPPGQKGHIGGQILGKTHELLSYEVNIGLNSSEGTYLYLL